jgi:hypothetical protein
MPKKSYFRLWSSTINGDIATTIHGDGRETDKLSCNGDKGDGCVSVRDTVFYCASMTRLTSAHVKVLSITS